ncbi:MAG: sigma-70 family RNA polymerase sigma factor [Lachnospiraceae bacterium]|nr:sigma-70 family RNA polymerase sigma factor [Lachnospiraceae bacterium]
MLKFHSWYYRVMKNEFRNELKKLINHKRHYDTVSIEELENIMSFIQPKDIDVETVLVGSTLVIITDHRLAIVLKRLSDRIKRVIEGTVILQLPVKTIAEEMKISEQAVKNYKHDGLQRLKRWLEAYHD